MERGRRGSTRARNTYACRRENGPNAPYTAGIVSIVNGHKSVVVARLRVYGAGSERIVLH